MRHPDPLARPLREGGLSAGAGRAGLAERSLVLVVFSLYLLVGISVFRDYGFHWDQINNWNLGMVTWSYIFEGIQYPLFLDPLLGQSHGAAFQFLLILVEKSLGLTDWRDITFARHLCTFLLSFVGVFFFYLLCRRHLESWKLALCGSVLLMLTPRVFAHSFYNSVDIPCMVLFVVSMYTLVHFSEAPSHRAAVLHGVSCAALISVRSLGLLVPALTLLAVLLRLASFGFRSSEARRSLLPLISFAVTLSLAVYLVYPYLWEDPARRFLASILAHANLSWPHQVLFLGEFFEASRVPWYYNFAWIGITQPLVHLAGFVIGLLVLPFELRRRGWLSPFGRRNLLFLCWLGLPLLAPILLRPPLYDGWRHHYFVYPAFLIIALTGLEALVACTRAPRLGRWGDRLRAATVLLIVLGMLDATWFMVKQHPHQHVYFNRWAGSDLRQRFDLDYWGLSYRQALEHIAATDASERIRVCVANDPGLLNSLILPPSDRARLKLTGDPTQADYFVGNFRWHPADYRYGSEVFSIEVRGAKIVTVQKIR